MLEIRKWKREICKSTRKGGIVVACLVVLGVHLFAIGYEEPTLRRMFGAEYEEYSRNVSRWVPRLPR